MIEGKKIILRAYKESDIEISFKLINTLNIRTMLGRNNIFPFSMSAQKEFVEKAMINNQLLISLLKKKRVENILVAVE